MERPALISYLDTHVVVFLHAGDLSRLSIRAQNQIENTDLLISAIVCYGPARPERLSNVIW